MSARMRRCYQYTTISPAGKQAGAPEETAMIPSLPKEATAVLDAIAAAGGRGYLVGGALRDLLRGARPDDWDFAASLSPQQLLGLFEEARPVGGRFGTVQIPFGAGKSCEITPCRTEEGYSDGRHPDKVVFVPDILQDLSRRDFTVNAMAFDGQVLLDPYGGQQDLQNRLLRCVGKPKQRFEEDALRVLRLFRLAAQLGFTAEWETYKAACEAMDAIALLPRERVYAELHRTLLSGGAKVLGALIAKGGLTAYGLRFAPELSPLQNVPPILLHRMWALAALCGADTDVLSESLGLSEKFTRQMQACTRLYRAGPANDRIALKQKLRYAELDYGPLAATFAAVSPAFAAEPALYGTVLQKKEPYRLADLAVDGVMLRYEGISGKKCGHVLHELLSVVIKNPEMNRVQTLLALAKGLGQLY